MLCMHIGYNAKHQCTISKQHVIYSTFRDINRNIFSLYRYGLSSRQFYNGKDRTLNSKYVAVTVKTKIGK